MGETGTHIKSHHVHSKEFIGSLRSYSVLGLSIFFEKLARSHRARPTFDRCWQRLD